MRTSRRKFMANAMGQAAGAGLVATGFAAARTEAAAGEATKKSFTLFPIGAVEKKETEVRLRIFDDYVDGLLGLEEWSHAHVFYWFDRNDTPGQRRVLRVHPRGNQENPLTGVFACRAPVRPNLIALSVCKIVAVRKSLVTVDDLDAFDGTPILDLKPVIPLDMPKEGLKIPAWARRGSPANP